VSGPPPPQRVPTDVDDAGRRFATVVDLLDATIARAAGCSEGEQSRRVNDEWSTIESLQHIVFVIDVWLGRTVKGEEDPFHAIGLPPHFIPRKLPGSSIDPEAHPTFEEACDVLRGRLATLGVFIDGLTADELARPIEGHARTVAGALGVIFDEITYHAGFMNRDLDALDGAKRLP